MSSSGDAQVLALAKLIYETAGKIVKEYNDAGHSVPSLDSTEPSPFDAPGKLSADLGRSMRIIEGACAQLSIMVNRPSHVVANKAYNSAEVCCLKVVHDAKVADHLLDKPNGVPINELATKTGLDASKLSRVMRMLATTHCFREVSPDVFANNRVSVQLCSNNPVNSLVGLLVDEATLSSAYLSEILSDPELGTSLSLNHTAFYKAYGTTAFEFYARPENAKYHERFAQAMVGFAEETGKSAIPQAIPWASVPEGSTICDMGGGNGHITLDLAKQFPNLRVIIQDLPNVIEQAKEFWSENFPEAIQTQRVQFVPYNFFEDSPVSGCQFYFIRHVLHDWPNAECLKILSNVRKVMSADSRLLINEFVLQNVSQDKSSAKDDHQAPEPMLSNYGFGGIRAYQQDILMLTLQNSQERKLQEFISLAEQAGFKYEDIMDVGEANILSFSAM